MVLVASSRSASTALPREQNQPGRRLEQAAQPTGTCLLIALCRTCGISSCSRSPILLPPRAGCEAQPTASQLSDLGEGCIEVETLRARMDPFLNPSLQDAGNLRCDAAHVYVGREPN